MTAKILKIVQNGWHILRNHSRPKPKQKLLLLMECVRKLSKKSCCTRKKYNRTAVETELIDYALYLIKAHERYYLYLMCCIEEEKERTKKIILMQIMTRTAF